MYAPLYFTNNYFDVDAKSWRVIRYAFFGSKLHITTNF